MKEELDKLQKILVKGITTRCTISDPEPGLRGINIANQKDDALREALEVVHYLKEKSTDYTGERADG